MWQCGLDERICRERIIKGAASMTVQMAGDGEGVMTVMVVMTRMENGVSDNRDDD